MQSVAKWMPTLMDNYKVLTYNGQLDIILGAPAAEKYYKTIDWSGNKEYNNAKKQIWKVPGDPSIAGYVRSVRNYRQVVVLACGHMVPLDNVCFKLFYIYL